MEAPRVVRREEGVSVNPEDCAGRGGTRGIPPMKTCYLGIKVIERDCSIGQRKWTALQKASVNRTTASTL